MIRAEVAKEVERTRGIPQEHNSMNDLAILKNHVKIMAEMQIRKETQTVEPVQTLAQLVKPLKPALWTKDMSMETYGTQIENWVTNQHGIPEHKKFNDLVESLYIYYIKANKYFKPLHHRPSPSII